MKSRVKIGGKVVSGEFTRTKSGFELSYDFEGDGCALTYDGHSLTHRKGGEIPVKIVFCEGGKSACEIGDSSLYGAVEVETRALSVREEGGRISVSVDYLLGGDRAAVEISVYPEDENFE